MVFAILALVVLLFSVVSRPDPLAPETSLEPFDEVAAATDARRLMELAPERRPGSSDGVAAAGFVAAEFESMEGGSPAEHPFDASFQGDTVQMTNVSLTLAGESDELIVITAPRDCEAGPCAASSAASTGALLELARGFSRSHHYKSLMFVSTDGSVAGAAGVKQLAEDLAQERVTAILVLSAAGVDQPRGRTVVPWSTGTRATSIQLLLSAEEAVRTEFSDSDPLPRSTLSELVRLAIPAGLGEQGPLIAEGYPAVGIAGGGPRPLLMAEDEAMSVETLGAMGRTSLSLARSLDAGPAALEPGPSTRIPLAGKLVPGWALSLLAASLLLPIAIVAVEAVARAGRAGAPLGGACLWLFLRVVPIFGVLALAVALGRIGVLPAPPFPFDPTDYGFGVGPTIALVAMTVAMVAGTIALGRMRPRPASEPAVTAALILGLALGGFSIWLINPYLALALIPALHLWLAAAAWGSGWNRLASIGLVTLGLAVPLIVLAFLGAQFGTDLLDAPWQLLLLFTGGHFPLLSALPIAVVLATAFAVASTAKGGWTDVRTPESHALRQRRPIQSPGHGRELGKIR